MKVEVFCGGNIEQSLNEIGIEVNTVYNNGTYKVVEMDKKDLKKLEDYECTGTYNAWYYYFPSSTMGTAYEFVTINDIGMIAWLNDGKKDKYDSLMDYIEDGLELTSKKDICDVLVGLGKYNGKTMKWLLENLM